MFSFLLLAIHNKDTESSIILFVVIIILILIVAPSKHQTQGNASKKRRVPPESENEVSAIMVRHINTCISEIEKGTDSVETQKLNQDGVSTKKGTWILRDGRMLVVKVAEYISFHEGVASSPWTNITIKYWHKNERCIVISAVELSLRVRHRQIELANQCLQLLRRCESLVARQS